LPSCAAIRFSRSNMLHTVSNLTVCQKEQGVLFSYSIKVPDLSRYNTFWRRLSSGLLSSILCLKFTDKMHAATIIRTMALQRLWNVDKLLRDYIAQQHRRQTPSYSLRWEPQISFRHLSSEMSGHKVANSMTSWSYEQSNEITIPVVPIPFSKHSDCCRSRLQSGTGSKASSVSELRLN
jgi:hypothetical protein